MHKLQGHSSEIHSLAWCPAPKEDIDFGKFLYYPYSILCRSIKYSCYRWSCISFLEKRGGSSIPIDGLPGSCEFTFLQRGFIK